MIELEKHQPWLTDKKWILPVTVLLSVIVYFLLLFLIVSLVIFIMYERVYFSENQQTLAEYKLERDRLEELKANYKVISVSNKNLESAIEERSHLYEETKKMKSTFDLEKRMEIIK